MASFNHFNTRNGSNEGIQFPLFDLDGKQTEHWIVLRGVDSDAFTKVKDKMTRLSFLDEANFSALKELKRVIADVDDKEKADAEKHLKIIESVMRNAIPESERRLEMQAALIKEWSFDEECTKENKIEFLRGAPYLAELIDTKAADRSAFIKKK